MSCLVLSRLVLILKYLKCQHYFDRHFITVFQIKAFYLQYLELKGVGSKLSKHKIKGPAGTQAWK